MSELERFRDHCRERATWQRGKARAACLERTSFGTPKSADHANCGGGDCGCECHEPTDAERALFVQLASEIDEYLHPADDEPLWGDA